MSAHRKKITDQFDARSNSGTVYRVLVVTDVVSSGVMGDPRSELMGMREMRLTTGEHVNVLHDGRLEVVETGEVLRRIAD